MESPRNTTQVNRPTIEPSTIGQFIALDGCPRYFQFEFKDEFRTEQQREHEYKEAFEPLSLLLSKEGKEFEHATREQLASITTQPSNPQPVESWDQTQQTLRTIFDNVNTLSPTHAPISLSEVRLTAEIGAWNISGFADSILVWPTTDGIKIRLFEIKAAHEEKTYQQIQVATYTLILRTFLEAYDPPYQWEIEGGILHRHTPITSNTATDLPKFDLESRELDVKRLLEPDGKLDELWTENPRDVKYQINAKCHNCTYKEACQSTAIENESPALLGLTRGEQNTLAAHNITTIEDLAELAYPPSDPRPYQYEELTPVKQSKYHTLVNETGIGERLPQYIQRAQSYLQTFSPKNTFTPSVNHQPPWLVGSGPGSLPEDNPGFDDDYLDIPRNELIRAYINVQYDHRQDRIVMLSAYISATKYLEQHPPITISHIADEVAETEQKRNTVEKTLLERFFSELFDSIQDIAEHLDTTTPVFHWYFYTPNERENLRDAVDRHDEHQVIRLCRDILDHRESIDQAMVSSIQPEIRSRIAIPNNNYGLLPVVDCFHPSQEAFQKTNWEYERTDGTTIDLRTAFERKFFDYYVPYSRSATGLDLYATDDPDGFYPSRRRIGAQLPLEYIWSAVGALKNEWEDTISDEYSVGRAIDPYRWVDLSQKDLRIQKEDLQALGERLARCMAHVERGIDYRNSNVTKRPVRFSEFGEYTLPESSLRRAAVEYLQLEHSTQRSDLFSHYRLPVEQRVRRGDSIPLVIRSVQLEQQEAIIEGELLYDPMFNNGNRVAGACRQKGATRETSGSWMVANEIDRQGKPVGSSDPRDIERGPGVIIDELDIEDRHIRLRSIQSYLWRDQEFQRQHRDWTTVPSEEDEDTVCFEEGRLFVLDPRSDDITAQRAWDVLRAGDSTITSRVEELVSGDLQSPRVSGFSPVEQQGFLSWLESESSLAPNDRQRAFITDVESQFVLLQGPPGTGKTSGALASAIVARVASKDALTGVVSGESHKAVNEIVSAVCGLLEEYRHSVSGASFVDQVEIVQLTDAEPNNPHDLITYLDYHSESPERDRVISRLVEDRDREEMMQSGNPVLLVFGTPARIYGLINKLDEGSEESVSPEDRVGRNESLFDLVAVDEASMMRLSSFLMIGAFSHDETQFLITGDHRQLSPVQQHDWPGETRRIIQEYAPFLSVLDYFRAINGESPDTIPNDARITGEGAVPFYRLAETYRCHQSVSSMLQEYVYSQDNIDYHSSITRTLTVDTDEMGPGLATILNQSPITLVIHDDRSSQQSNVTEAVLCAEIMAAVEGTVESGVVTPHNAQRGRLKSMLGEQVEIETVERYQGGQRECMIVSATASDPDFLFAEQDFILNPNRLNVALSRMKTKLIVTAAESIFELIPRETDQYEQSRLWKGLYNEVGVFGREPDWEGSVQSVQTSVTANVDAPGVTVRVYSLP